MLSRTLRPSRLMRLCAPAVIRSYSSPQTPVSKTNEVPSLDPSMGKEISETLEEGEKARSLQSPNRTETWSRSQQKRELAMSGPRFEHTIFELQKKKAVELTTTKPAPEAAIELIHKQPVRWTHDRIVSCDGGGGPLGHPRVFINVDKPEICTCNYCGLPFANEHHREFLKTVECSYPLEPTGQAEEVNESQRVTDHPFEQR